MNASHVISCPIAKLCSCSEMETEQSTHGVLAIKKFVTVEEVMEYLTNADKFQCNSVPPAKPKGNEVCLYRANDAGKEGTCILYTSIKYKRKN